MPRITLPNRTEWLQYRSRGIGASDAPVILGLSPWKSALQLYAEKLGLMDLAQAETEYLKWGLRLEPVMREAYAEETGRSTSTDDPFTIQIHPFFDWMFATLDGYAIDADKGTGVLELKTANVSAHRDWQDGAPLMYQVQVQHQLAVTGLQWGAIAVLIGGNTFLHYDVERDDAFIERLIQAENLFWTRTCRGQAPDPDHSESAALALGKLYPTPVANRVALPPAVLEFDAQRQRGIELILEGERLKTEAENHVKAALQANVEGILPNGVVYTWKTQERAGRSFRVLRRRDS